MFLSLFENFCAVWLILYFLWPSLGTDHSWNLVPFLLSHVEISIWTLSVFLTGRVLLLLAPLADRGMFIYLCYLTVYLYILLYLLPYIYLPVAVQYLSLPPFHFYKSLLPPWETWLPLSSMYLLISSISLQVDSLLTMPWPFLAAIPTIIASAPSNAISSLPF